MKAILLTAIALVSGALAQKVDPPDHSNPGPGYYIADDVDYIATANGNASACPSVQAIRSKCYSEGIQAKSIEAEWKCLCDPDSAYAITQCFARNYQKLDSASKSNYYQDFLYYTYDCYCGVTQSDVTYNTTKTPSQPYIKGYTGDPILPPEGGCPAPNSGSGSTPVAPKPPCGCVPPKQATNPPCQSGYTRVGKKCVKDPDPCEPCEWPKIINEENKCVCPWYTEPTGDTCGRHECPANEVAVYGWRGWYCTCESGYERDSTGKCVKYCPYGEIPDGNGGCRKCPENQIPDYDGKCICPVYYGYQLVNDVCIPVECGPNELFSNYGGCYCPSGFYEDSSGQCVELTCDQYDDACYPGENSTNDTPISISSSAPPYSSYTSSIPTGSSTMTSDSSTITSGSSSDSSSSSSSSSDSESSSTTSSESSGGGDSPTSTTESFEPPTLPSPSPGDGGSGDGSSPGPTDGAGGGESGDSGDGSGGGSGGGSDDGSGGSSGGDTSGGGSSGGDTSGGGGSGGGLGGDSSGGGGSGGDTSGGGSSGGDTSGGGSSGGDTSGGAGGGGGGGDTSGGDTSGGDTSGGGSTARARVRARQVRNYGRWY